MKFKIIITLLLIFLAIKANAQVVIGSKNTSPAAILKLDAGNKALRIPNLSVTNRVSTIAPIASPATGVMLYNTNTNINTDIAKGVTYWGSDNSYHSEASYSATEAIISSSNIPLLVFSAAIGQKPNVPVGYTAGGPFTNLSLTGPEILFDKYAAWNPAGNQYKIPASGVYMVEYISEMSNAANMGGTPSLRISNSTTNTNIITGYGRFIPLANRMYTTLIITQNLLSTDVLIFKYIYTDNNYRMEKGTLNIYKY